MPGKMDEFPGKKTENGRWAGWLVYAALQSDARSVSWESHEWKEADAIAFEAANISINQSN